MELLNYYVLVRPWHLSAIYVRFVAKRKQGTGSKGRGYWDAKEQKHWGEKYSRVYFQEKTVWIQWKYLLLRQTGWETERDEERVRSQALILANAS